MSVISRNPFAFLEDEGDDSPAPAPAPKPVAKKPAEPAPAPRNVPGAVSRGGRGRGTYPARGSPRNGARDSQPRNTAPTADEGVTEGFETPAGFEGERVATHRRPYQGLDAHTKGPRGNRSSRGVTSGGHTARLDNVGSRRPRVVQDAAGRRQYERRSGTVGDSQKKVDQGWGAATGTAELTDEVQGEKDAQVEENAPQTPAEEDDGGWGAPATTPAVREADAEAAEPAEPEEPEEVVKSYDQFLAERAAQAFDFGKKEARQVGTQSLEGKAFVREALDEFFNGKEKSGSKPSKSKKEKEKVFIEVDGQFASPASFNGGGGGRGRGGDRGRGGRGGRGGGRGGERGGRGRGGSGFSSRGGRQGNIDANDTSAFPALGGP
ncbi:hypothetical protein M231_03444 [Tremella mesenterica]|uniref:Hyaluronan/mRNA-binding protein domain-containing protein n=1 Tax=Tremella mesenterica TaxID=5217 RepID=A0A4Q1BMZ8_TREME|nr:uncharacterized protein TREMEDRAFT_70756 [Tremella mesenterica DSM 1558]EIW72576.1 hypothetical protein TREMEDRAFT_70756 [Tremella mesenterica DSM 1558]RXK39224.1 hypothetical protein M231_03444 [Tremella mesenterica]